MKKVNVTKKAKIRTGFVVVLFAAILVIAISQKISLGQTYYQVRINDEVIGCVSRHTDVKNLLNDVRRELAAGQEDKLCMDYTWEASEEKKPFTGLVSKEELKNLIIQKLTPTVIEDKTHVYTVAIDEYRANFLTMEEVYEFLNKVKAEKDENNAYITTVEVEESHINGIMSAQLKAAESVAQGNIQEAEQKVGSDDMNAGVSKAISSALSYVTENPQNDDYEVGLLGMDFIESVDIFENYVGADEVSDVDTQVAEVTKEKETNKIYEVQSGDCLSVIAMDYDTTVANIIMLNQFESAEQQIRPGDELIIAVPEPDLGIRVTTGEVYEEEYTAEPVIIENDSWYTTDRVVQVEGSSGERERNDIVVVENGVEVSRTLAHETILVESVPATIEVGTIIPPTYIKPLSGGRLSSGFGYRWGRLHKGVDWACPTGTTIYASCAGTVLSAGLSRGYGYNVVISHPDGRMTRYAHCSKLLVSAGQSVSQGQTIALSGNTGNSTGPHLHFEIYINGSPVNPLNYVSY